MKKYTGWQVLATRQSKEILTELIEAKESQKALLLISNTGLGKSHTIKLFKKQNPAHTYVITVGNSYKLHDVVNEIVSILGISDRYNSRTHHVREKLNSIAEKLQYIQAQGGAPMIILDEAENLMPATLKMLKELYDAVIEYCSVVLIGTEQILDSMLNRKHKNRQSVPQLWRRFKAGTRYISALNKQRDFKQFFDLYIPGDAALQALLIELCENYGELHDYLEPALRRADKKQQPLTEELFRLVHKLPAPKLKIA